MLILNHRDIEPTELHREKPVLIFNHRDTEFTELHREYLHGSSSKKTPCTSMPSMPPCFLFFTTETQSYTENISMVPLLKKLRVPSCPPCLRGNY